jgi:hypothetical protein
MEVGEAISVAPNASNLSLFESDACHVCVLEEGARRFA